jgi:hypothetical protein
MAKEMREMTPWVFQLESTSFSDREMTLDIAEAKFSASVKEKQRLGELTQRSST